MSRPVCAIVDAGEGLGRSLAARFAGEGFDIALISRSEAGSRAAADAAASASEGAMVRFLAADAAQPQTIERALSTLVREMGEVQVLIYNARGSFARCEPLAMTYAQLDDIYHVDVVGAFAAAKSVIPAMRERGQRQRAVFERDGGVPGLGNRSALRHRQVRAAGPGTMPGQGVREGWRPRRALSAGLRSGRAADAGALRRQVQSGGIGRPRCRG